MTIPFTHVLVDLFSLGYAAQAATKLTCGGREVQAIFGVLKRVQEIKARYPGCRPLILWDGKAKWREAIYPEYKAGRDKDPKQNEERAKFREQRPDIRRGLDLLGVMNLYSPTSEADDLAGYLIKRGFGTTWRGLLVTGDEDWQQLIRENVSWYSPRVDRWVHHETFFDMTGYKTPVAFLQGKALQGDTSDNVKGVGGIGEKGAPEFLAHFGSVPAFIKAYNEGITPWAGVTIKKAWADLATSKERQALFVRNMKLMNLMSTPQPTDLEVTKREPNLPAFREFCEEFAFNSILREFQTFTKPFLS